MKPLWSQTLGTHLRGLTLAREKGALLAWNDQHTLDLFNRHGERQAQRQLPGAVTACAADDGSAYAAAGSRGEVWWLAPDLTPRWEAAIRHPAVMAALDPFGQYLAVSDVHGHLQLFDHHGRPLCRVQSPRPLYHLAFVPAAPFLLGSADYGLVACFDLAGRCVWRLGLVAHTGSLAVSGDGQQIVLAGFTEGLLRYNLTGHAQGRWGMGEPCRLAALAFDGRCTLAAGHADRLLLLDGDGKTSCTHVLDKPAIGLTVSALGERAFAALADGRLVGLDLREVLRHP